LEALRYILSYATAPEFLICRGKPLTQFYNMHPEY
jgi:hypothetical protein